MYKHFRDHAKQEVLEKRDSELKAGPVVAGFHNFQAVALE